MTMKDFTLRFAGFILIALAGLPLYAVTVNGLVYFGMIPPELAETGFGNALTMKTMFVWTGCVLLGGIAIFLKQGWAKIFYFSPLYAPSLYAAIHTIIQS